MSRRFKPYRSLRSEIASLALIALVPFALVAVFPFAALRPPSSVQDRAEEAACAFVTLTPAEEQRARMAARAAWQTGHGAARSRRIDLLAEALPPMRPRAAFDISARSLIRHDARVPYRSDVLPPTLAAPPPATIAPQPDADRAHPTFSREELLKLN